METRFQPLPPENQGIKLVTILPSILQSSPAKCHLQVVPLATVPPFEELFYVWDDDQDEKQIYVDNSAVTITNNIRIALLHLW
ncbi:hypothetical protein ASPWEDRAFT_44791 [Aspergillus wentii DTO 134E9]|uniref:Heterokaryon incompatibility domain-containing protein n=1 Tax=Aspergillus wentii DTO 134E9 TaxID=1073089 RepID=A0A1L9R7A2_ASPWE|nr:uncharacterized protein ASPWEDRAFT_44791 [Aspergillus wentii DTO 134E9]OJJ30805.1 hypothetical protein ASPWEDRAFT_44791 [Aspergillus wentii DTO 134E9]